MNSKDPGLYLLTYYGRQMKPFFNNIPNFWAKLADRPNKLWDIWGTITTHFGTVISILQCFFFYKKLCFSDLTQISQI